MMRRHFFVVTIALLGVVGSAHAQSLQEGLRLYRDGNYEQAAYSFYDVLRADSDPQVRDESEIYLAGSLHKMGLYVPALFYYTDIFKSGKRNRFYLNAAQGLLDIQEELHDHLIVPSLFSEYLDSQAFGKLEPAKVAQINFLLGELSVQKNKLSDAEIFLKAVDPSSILYPKAQYFLGLVYSKRGQDDAALARFREAVKAIDPVHATTEQQEVLNLTHLALGRVLYGAGQFDASTQAFGKVARLSEPWFNALFDSAWAYFQMENYGAALGQIQSVSSPYFSKRHIPEAYVLQGTTYFVNCQWDRVRATVLRYQALYGTMEQQLQAFLAKSQDPSAYYTVLIADAQREIPLELVREVRRTRRFADFHHMLNHLAWEESKVRDIAVWQGSDLKNDLALIMTAQGDQLKTAVGSWTKTRLVQLAAQLQNFSNQVNILDFEVADAERKWLEQGREIAMGQRARLPRPEIPTDQWQHWNFQKEFWKDEIGYYRHALRTECK